MFDNIATLRFQKGAHNEVVAVAMCSSEGEVMEYRSRVTADGRVEDWMTNVLNEMRRTNRLITKEAVYYYRADGTARSRLLFFLPLLSVVHSCEDAATALQHLSAVAAICRFYVCVCYTAEFDTDSSSPIPSLQEG